MTPAAKALVREHLAAGDVAAIVTATNAFVTGPIARAFGICHLIATIPEQQDGRFTGLLPRHAGLPGGKIARVESWLESLGLWWTSFSRTTFYSDSHNDLPLLERVDEPVAVDPDERLRMHALTHGWRILFAARSLVRDVLRDP